MNVRMRSRRGPIGTSWYAVALREALQTALGSTRAAAGRRLARAGSVQWLDVTPGVARAAVRDADGTLASARLDVSAIRPDDRPVVLGILARTPDLPARLAAGEYPERVEQQLLEQEVSLIPSGAAQVSHDCTCLDWPGPCVHVQALAAVLVEAVEEEPVLLLRLRGLEIADLTAPVTPGAPVRAPGDGAAARPGPAGAADGGSGSGRSDGDSDDLDAGFDDDAGSGAGGLEDSTSDAPRFDPAAADATLLVGELGAEAARVLAMFYGAEPPGPETGPARRGG